jgi:hypothetical protein
MRFTSEQFGKGSRGYFTLGILGGKDDNKYLGSQQPWFRRCFNILLALNDLIATADLDGILLVDNEILMDRLEKKGKLEEHEAVLGNRMDFNKFIKEEFGLDWVENAEIARSEIKSDGNEIYYIYDVNENFAEIKIEDKRQSAILKISDGQIYNLKAEKLFLFKWDDVLQKVDGGLLSFLRDDLDLKWVENAEIRKNDGGNTIRISKDGNSTEITIGDDSKKATIKVRDGKTYNLKVENKNGKLEIYARKIQGRAYADKLDEELTKMIYPAFGITACEKPDSDIDWAQLKHHMKLEEQEQRSPIFVPCYASGDVNGNMKDLIDDALENGKLAKCDYKITDKIICYVREIRDVDNLKKILSDKFDDTTTADVKIIEQNAKKTDVLNGVSAKIIVFESKTSKEEKEERKENEVLLLMRNCNVKNTLYNRLKVAQRFVDLLVAFKDLIEKKGKPKEKIAGEIIDKERDKLIDFIEVCLFSWDDIPQKVSGKLSNFLCEYLNLKWAENAEISKVDDKTIRISKDGNSSEIIIDEDKKKAILKYSDGKTHDLKLKNDNGKLNVYWELIPTDGIEEEYLFSWDKVQDDKVQDDKKEAENKQAKNKLMKSLREFFYIGWATDLKIKLEGNKIICTPAARDRPVITIERGAKETATLKIGDDKTYNLTIRNENGEQKVYESENRAVEKILQEAKSFLLPMDVGPQKMEETYNDMIKIVAKLKKVVDDAINNLDAGITPIFTDPIFDITSAVASDDEAILTLMLAMGEDTYATYRDALGGDKVDQLFNDFQRETLEDRKYVESSGDTDDYILSYTGENILVKALKEELDKVSIAIEKPLDLLKEIDTKKFLEVVKKVKGGDISFPKLLVLSFLYTRWEDVCRWDNISGSLFRWDNVTGDDTERIRNFLKMEHHIDWAENARIDKHDNGKTISISKDEKSAEILIDTS